MNLRPSGYEPAPIEFTSPSTGQQSHQLHQSPTSKPGLIPVSDPDVINAVTIGRLDASIGDSTLPLFPTLEPRPRHPDGLFLVSWFAYEEHVTGRLVPGARREIQRMLQRASGIDVSRRLTSLTDGFLRCKKVSKRGHAYEYGLAPSVPQVDRERWIDLGRLLFDPSSGLVGGFLTRPPIKHGHVKLIGFLVLAIVQGVGSIARVALARLLDPIVSRPTVYNRVAFLYDIGVLQMSNGSVQLAVKWKESLQLYEDMHGLTAWAEPLSALIEQDRINYRTYLAGGRDVVAHMDWLRRQPCSVFGGPGGFVDHLPPKHWGGFNQRSLMFPICWPHNNDLGNMVRNSPAPPVKPISVRSLPSTSRRAEAAPMWLQVAHWLYLEAVRRNDYRLLERSRRLVEALYLRWCAETMGSHWVQFERIDATERRRFGRRVFRSR